MEKIELTKDEIVEIFATWNLLHKENPEMYQKVNENDVNPVIYGKLQANEFIRLLEEIRNK
jgi:hypothetical protein